MYTNLRKNIEPIVYKYNSVSLTHTNNSLTNPLPLINNSIWQNGDILNTNFLEYISAYNYYYFKMDTVIKLNFRFAVASRTINNNILLFGLFRITANYIIQDGNKIQITLDSPGIYYDFYIAETVILVPKNYSLGISLKQTDDLLFYNDFKSNLTIYAIK